MAGSYVGLVLQLVSTMVIARILTPKEIGVFAVAAVFSGLAAMFRDFGVAEYMIQEKDLTRDKIAAALTLNIIVSWTMSAAMYLGAPFAAAFYGNPGIASVMKVQALGFLMVPFSAVTMAYFRRQLEFRPVLVCNIAGNVAGFVFTLALVLMGFGYMGLAWGAVASIALTVAIGIWYRPSDFPRWPGLRGLGEVFHFSKFASLIYIAGQLGRGAPEMVIGRAESVVEVAMFSRAGGLVEIAQRLLLRPVHFVCMPYFAKSDREHGSITQAYLKSVTYLTGIGWPFLAFMGLAAFSLIRIVYGNQWDVAVPLAQILCAACALEIVHMMSREALLACGRARDANVLQMGLLALQATGLFAVVPFGLVGAAWGVLAAQACGVALSQLYLRRGIGLHTRDLLRACVPSVLLSAGALAPVAALTVLNPADEHNYAVVGVVGGVLTVVSWLVALRLVGHPLQQELAPFVTRFRDKLPWRR